jgi:hypothetical protein
MGPAPIRITIRDRAEQGRLIVMAGRVPGHDNSARVKPHMRSSQAAVSADCVIRSWWLPFPALHQPIECRHVGTLSALSEKACRIHGRRFCSAGYWYRLIDADPVGFRTRFNHGRY